MQDAKITVVEGQAIALPGNDIDTDRIIPARFLRCVTFDGLGEHAFEDDRAQAKAQGEVHPFDDPQVKGARILCVARNFGCGSSREHAPQALLRWGIAAIVGESFAEIFFGNCTANGIPCACAAPEDIERLMQMITSAKGASFKLDLETLTIKGPGVDLPVTMPDGPREQLRSGRWDSTIELLAGAEQTVKTAARLPYFQGFAQ